MSLLLIVLALFVNALLVASRTAVFSASPRHLVRVAKASISSFSW